MPGVRGVSEAAQGTTLCCLDNQPVYTGLVGWVRPLASTHVCNVLCTQHTVLLYCVL